MLIVTKGELSAVSRILINLEEYRDKIEFRFTIGSNDSAVTDYWEPGAPKDAERCISLSFAYTSGFKTSVSMEPLLIENPAKFISAMDSTVTSEIWIGMMNHYALNPAIPEHARQIKIQSRENLQRVYEATKDNPKVRYKDSMRELLGLPANP